MDPNQYTEMVRGVMSGTMTPQHSLVQEGGTREEQIKRFNQAALECRSLSHSRSKATTTDFNKKARSRQMPLGDLETINISDLKEGKIHRGRVVFCSVVSDVMVMNSASVLVEDENDVLTPLAIYGLGDTGELRKGRSIAIKEPFFKVRADGTKGIRVDDPSDLVFDVKRAASTTSGKPVSSGEKVVSERLSAEARLEELVISDENISTNKLHKMMLGEGYNISRKQVRALKTSIFDQQSHSKKETPPSTGNPKLIAILSERRPEMHRMLSSPTVLKHREAGNDAFKCGKFKEAEASYTKALLHINDDGKSKEGVALWQLYGNRCAARMKLGMLDDAMQDSLASNMCAPADVVKPILRCAEALVALGLRKESDNLLDAALGTFLEEKRTIENKRQTLAPKQVLRVGPGEQFSSVADAVKFASPGAEVLVKPGIYKEPLVLSKSVTLRSTAVSDDYHAIRALEGENLNDWAEISVSGYNAISCFSGTVNIIGFRITCTGELSASYHSILTSHGVIAVVRNCSISSLSGPVVVAEHPNTKLIMHACAVHSGVQGGILVVDHASLTSRQVHCCQHAASGLELRTGGSAFIEGSHFYGNGRQGISLWKSSGCLTIKHSEIHSNTKESGACISEAKASFQSCQIYGNGGAGVVAQQKGNIELYKCDVHNNCEGVLIQDTGRGKVEKCNIFSNRANGIFVGFDQCRGSVTIVDNNVHDNFSRGILVGNDAHVVLRENKEQNNRGLPPQMPASPFGSFSPRQMPPKQFKRLKKNKGNIAKAFEEQSNQTFFGHIVENKAQEMSDNVVKTMEKLLKNCSFCEKSPSTGEEFKRCSRCRAAFYCSPKCQKLHWPQHKAHCTPKDVKYPAFLDSRTSV